VRKDVQAELISAQVISQSLYQKRRRD